MWWGNRHYCLDADLESSSGLSSGPPSIRHDLCTDINECKNSLCLEWHGAYVCLCHDGPSIWVVRVVARMSLLVPSTSECSGSHLAFRYNGSGTMSRKIRFLKFQKKNAKEYSKGRAPHSHTWIGYRYSISTAPIQSRVATRDVSRFSSHHDSSHQILDLYIYPHITWHVYVYLQTCFTKSLDQYNVLLCVLNVISY